MSAPVPTNPMQGPQEAPQTQNQAAGAKNSASEASASTLIRTMEDLKREAPELYKATLQGVAWTILRQVRKSARRLKKIQEEARRRN